MCWNSISFKKATINNYVKIAKMTYIWNKEQIDWLVYSFTFDDFIQKKYDFWVCYRGMKVIGYLSGDIAINSLPIFDLGKPVYHIENFYILPKYRGQGIGHKFLQFLENKLNMKGVNQFCVVTTSKKHEGTVGFYQSAGFQIYETKCLLESNGVPHPEALGTSLYKIIDASK